VNAATFSTIVHLDADAFFVSCEQARDPSLRGKKCAVGGRERGIISSASYEARACGVYTPMPTSRAKAVCPDLIMIPHTSGLYGKVSRQMFDLCETLTPLVQRNSIDEGYLDLGPCGYVSEGELEKAVRGLQARLWKELGLPVSFGIAANKLVAQIASKLRKPRGFVTVSPGMEADFLAPLSIGKLPGVGSKTETHLAEHGIVLIKDLFEKTPEQLKAALGTDWRGVLDRARGIDDRSVEVEREDAKSYSQQETFGENIGEFSEIVRILKGMIDDLMSKVREDEKRVRTMTLKVRYPDFTQATHGRSLEEATDLEAPFYAFVEPLLREVWKQRRPLRLVSVRFSNVEEAARQLEMFDQGEEKRRRLASVLDQLNRGAAQGRVTHGHQLAKKRPTS